MKQVAADSIEPAAERHSCTVCPLLCDDLAIAADGVERACPHGREAILAAVAAADASQPEASDDGRPTTREQGIRLAAAALSDARRVLVTGLAAGTLEAIAAACDVAELLGAAVDANLADSARSAGPTIARVGEVTAAWEELRDRADLVIFWCCDPVASHPRFLERFVGPELPDGRPRRTIAVGHDAVMPDGSLHRHLLLPDADAVEAARCLQLRCVGQSGPAALAAPLAAVCDTVHEAIRMATCVAIVTNDADDDIGLEAWSIVGLVRAIAHEKPAFQIPLGRGIAAGGGNVAGAAAACTWRYGAAGAIARADRMGGRFLPGEAAATRLIERGEVDAVLLLGRPDGLLERTVADRGRALTLVQICDSRTAALPADRSILLRCADTTIATAGTMLREDGRLVRLRSQRAATAPSMAELLGLVAAAMRRSPVSADDGGRP